MPQPYDYSIDIPNPMQAFMQSLQFGQQLKKQQQQQAMQERRQQIWSGLGPNATADDFLNAATALPEDSEAILRVMKGRDEATNKAMFDAGGKAWAQLTPGADGKIDATAAVATLNEYAAALENSGKQELAKQLRDSARALGINPAAGRNVLGMMLASADSAKFKAIAEIGENKVQKDIDNLAAIVGEEQARAMIVGREAAKGVVAITGPSGTQFMRAEEMFNLPAEQQPAAAANMVAGEPQPRPLVDSQNGMTVAQYRAAADALGEREAAAMLQRNNIPLRISNNAEYDKVPPGATFYDPSGVLRTKAR